MHGAPGESLAMCSDSGYINSKLFIEWLKLFRPKVRSDREHPVLFILDNHSSHKSLEAVTKSSLWNAIILFKALKTFYADECDIWLTTNAGGNITYLRVAKFLGKAYERYSTMDRGVKGFEDGGIYPINKNVFSKKDFLSSKVSYKNANEADHQINNSDPEDDVPLSYLLPNTSGTSSGSNEIKTNQIGEKRKGEKRTI